MVPLRKINPNEPYIRTPSDFRIDLKRKAPLVSFVGHLFYTHPMPGSSDPSIDVFIQAHWLIVLSTVVTCFGAGAAVGRFVFDRLVALLNGQVDDLTRRLAEARLQTNDALQEASAQTRQVDDITKQRDQLRHELDQVVTTLKVQVDDITKQRDQARHDLDRVVATLKTEADDFKMQRDEVRRQLEQVKVFNQGVDQSEDKTAQIHEQAAKMRAARRLMRALAAMALFVVLAYGSYQQSVIANSLHEHSLRESEFQNRTDVLLKSLEGKFQERTNAAIQPTPPQSFKRKVKPEDTASPRSAGDK